MNKSSSVLNFRLYLNKANDRSPPSPVELMLFRVAIVVAHIGIIHTYEGKMLPAHAGA